MSDMQFSLQAGALRQAVATARLATVFKDKIPVLSHLHLSAADERLTLTGCDLDLWLSATVPGAGALEPVTVHARRLAAILAHLPDEEMVSLRQAGAEQPLTLTAGPLTAQLYTIPPEDFPELAEWAPKVEWRIGAGVMRGMLGHCMHATSQEETRYYLNGIFLDPKAADASGPGMLSAVATDGHRLMVKGCPLPEGDAPLPGIIPNAAVRHLHALLASVPKDAPVTVRQQDMKMEVSAPRWTIRVKLIDGTFPNYAAVIPKEGGGVPIQVRDPRRLAAAIRTICAVSGDKHQPVKLSNGTGNTLRLSVQADGGMSRAETALPEDVAAWASDSAHPEAGFQARYLLDLCRVFDAGFTFRISTEVIRGMLAGPCRVEGADALGVLMPMRV